MTTQTQTQTQTEADPAAQKGWKGALYAGKRSKLRKIAFQAATRVESGKLVQTQKKKKKNQQSSEYGEAKGPKGKDDGTAASNQWRIMFRPGAGLHNLGNTCFMNSVLQCLTYTPPLAQSCLEQQYTHGGGGEKFDAMHVFQQHVNTVLRSPGTVVPPHKFSRSLRLLSNRFRLGRQEDAHEYFRCLVESMEKSFTSKISKKPTQEQIESCFIYKLFGGKLRSQIHCTGCNYKSNKFDPILDLNLEIFRTRSLEKALHMFTSKEILDGNNKYSCPKCKNMVKAVKQMLISEAPNVLAIQLKRFAFGKYGMKIENRISFPSHLDMSPYVSASAKNKGKDPVTYSLYGVLVHSGHSLHSGHYYCYVKCPSGAWVCCDDQYVQMVSEKKVLEQKAYMLFYTRETVGKTTTTTTRTTVTATGAGGGKRMENNVDQDPAAMKLSKSGNGQVHAAGAVQAQKKPKIGMQIATRGAAKATKRGSSSSSSSSPSASPSSPPRNGGETGLSPGSPGTPESPTRSPTRKPQQILGNGSSTSPLVSMSPSLQNSRWRRMLLCFPSKLRLHATSAMKQVVKEILNKKIVAAKNGTNLKRRRSLEDDFYPTRRSKRLLLKGKKSEDPIDTTTTNNNNNKASQKEKEKGQASASTPVAAPFSVSRAQSLDHTHSHRNKSPSNPGTCQPTAKAKAKAKFGAEVKEWLRGDQGTGPYGVPVKKWGSSGDRKGEGEGEGEATTSEIKQAKADKLFRRLRPKQKRRDWYDEEYDMGKVKKVKLKETPDGKQRLGAQSSAFQRAASNKFHAKGSRSSSRPRRSTSSTRSKRY